MDKVICIRNTIELFEDGDFITSDLVNIGEIYQTVFYTEIEGESYESIEVYSNTTDDHPLLLDLQ